ncbi:MAG: hypothetical protein H6982_15285 [Chromatiales bacterium]|nr:hypothetical protein [Chromatiales bacterium]
MSPSPQRLREIAHVRQDSATSHRRWFTCATADLFVWADATGIQAFELCYGKPRAERALRWTADTGLASYRIDAGERGPLRNDTPIASPDDGVCPTVAALAFEAVGAELDPALYRFVLVRVLAADPSEPV